MKGIHKRILTGFLSIVVLLFFSGMVSLYELNHMSGDINAILAGGRQGITASESVLTSLREYDKVVVNYAIAGNVDYAAKCEPTMQSVRARVADARSKGGKSLAQSYDSLSMVINQMDENVLSLRKTRYVELQWARDTLSFIRSSSFDGDEWYKTNFAPLYDEAMHRVMRVTSDAHNALTPRAESLSNNAYRAVTPVFISLLIMIVILLVFYFFIMLYIGRPVIQINKALDDTIRYKVPFVVKAECRDEVFGIKDKLEKLLNNTKSFR